MRGLVPYGDLGRLVTAPMSTCESSLKAIPLSASQASLPRLSQSGLPRSARPSQYFGLLFASGLVVEIRITTGPSWLAKVSPYAARNASLMAFSALSVLVGV